MDMSFQILGGNSATLNINNVSDQNPKFSKDLYLSLAADKNFKLFASESYLNDLIIYRVINGISLMLIMEFPIDRQKTEKFFNTILQEKFTLQSIDQAILNLEENIAFIFHSPQFNKTIIYADRFGLIPIYYFFKRDTFLFSNDLKSLISYLNEPPVLNIDAVTSFVYSGQLIGEMTWIKNIKVLNTSSRIIFEKNKQPKIERFWKWNNLKKNNNLKLQEAIQITNELFKNAVCKRIHPSKVNSIFFSGGQDSTVVLLAAHNNIKKAYHADQKEAITQRKRANKLCHDKEIELIKIRGLNIENLKTNIWNASCNCSLHHLHFSGYLDNFDQNENYFNGIPGDLTVGGSYLYGYNNPITPELAVNHPFQDCTFSKEFISKINFEDYAFEGTDPFYLETRVRHFTLSGMRALGLSHQVFPFLDITLINFLYTLKDDFRKNEKLYNGLLYELGFEKYSFPITFFDKVRNKIHDYNNKYRNSKNNKLLELYQQFSPASEHTINFEIFEDYNIISNDQFSFEEIILRKTTILIWLNQLAKVFPKLTF